MTRLLTTAAVAIFAASAIAQPAPAHAGKVLPFAIGAVVGAIAHNAWAHRQPHHVGQPVAVYQTRPVAAVQPFCRVHRAGDGAVIRVHYGRWCPGNTTDITM